MFIKKPPRKLIEEVDNDYFFLKSTTTVVEVVRNLLQRLNYLLLENYFGGISCLATRENEICQVDRIFFISIKKKKKKDEHISLSTL